MPTYPAYKTYRGGFYNNKKDSNGQDDRVYTAEDVRKPYDTVFTDGVMPEADGTAGNTLKVTAAGGMSITVNPGHGKLGGAWFENWAAYTITLDTAINTTRYDCVIVQNDDSEEVRASQIYIKSLSSAPTVSDLIRDGKIYEICIAYVRVGAMVAGVTDTDIVDTREDGGLCNVMSGVGAMVVRTYRNTYFSETANQRVIPIGIPQYNRTRDELTVIVEGRIFTEGTHYSVDSNSQITLAIGLPVVNTRIDFEVVKNVNAAGAETVIQEVAELREEMTAVNKTLEHHYYCNGTNDNAKISEICREFMNVEDYKSMRLIIHGIFGVTDSLSGAGTMNEPYRWFDFSGNNNTRRVILDFSDCSQLNIPTFAGLYCSIFYGDVRIEGATVIVNNTTEGSSTVVFEGSKNYHAKDCRFYINSYQHSYIAKRGTFENCRGSVANTRYYSSCFYATDDNVIRVIGGEYYAYRGDTSNCGVVIHAGATAVTILYGVNAPTLARSGYTQQYAISQTNDDGTGVLSCTDLISELPLDVVSGLSNIRGTIPLNKPGTM